MEAAAGGAAGLARVGMPVSAADLGKGSEEEGVRVQKQAQRAVEARVRAELRAGCWTMLRLAPGSVQDLPREEEEKRRETFEFFGVQVGWLVLSCLLTLYTAVR